jgi:hypothetical protein
MADVKITKLEQELANERKSRQELENKVQKLQDIVEQEAQKTQRLVLWIRDNLGPNLEVLKNVIDEQINLNSKSGKNGYFSYNIYLYCRLVYNRNKRSSYELVIEFSNRIFQT